MSSAAPALAGAGLVLDRYRPLRPLGSGGSGSVWLARDEHTGLDVALKIVAREGKAAARAEREAAAAARLRHRSCLRAYAFRRDARHVYIAYEFVPGRTFREALRAGELNDAAALEACSQICDGLAHAHAAGILHRDVKPSNVLLADGDHISVRLLDFGLARMAEAETLTAQGDVPGTLAYISPERLAGEDASEAADVWAVGVMLWESLAGRHPFWQASMLDTARAIEQGAPSLIELRPDLPKALIGLAVLYAAIAAVWVVLCWREPRGGLLFALGPALAPLAALALVPLAASGLRAGWRRAAQACVAVLAAAVVAGVRGAALPFTGARPPLGLGVAGATDPLDVAGTLARAVGAHPALVLEAVALAAVAFALPHAQALGRWGAAGVGAAMLAFCVLAVPSAAA